MTEDRDKEPLKPEESSWEELRREVMADLEHVSYQQLVDTRERLQGLLGLDLMALDACVKPLDPDIAWVPLWYPQVADNLAAEARAAQAQVDKDLEDLRRINTELKRRFDKLEERR